MEQPKNKEEFIKAVTAELGGGQIAEVEARIFCSKIVDVYNNTDSTVKLDELEAIERIIGQMLTNATQRIAIKAIQE